MEALNFLGLLGGVLSTICFLPQVIQAWKTKSTKDISLPMYLLLLASIITWIAYGFIRKDYPIVITNGTILLMTSTILYLKLKYK
jgi:MtN3 and saliva related transmembrane protein